MNKTLKVITIVSLSKIRHKDLIMFLVSTLVSECASRWKVVRSKEAEGLKRLFAFCEIVCFPLSWLALLILLVQLMLALLGCKEVLPDWFLMNVLPLLLSGAVGYHISITT